MIFLLIEQPYNTIYFCISSSLKTVQIDDENFATGVASKYVLKNDLSSSEDCAEPIQQLHSSLVAVRSQNHHNRCDMCAYPDPRCHKYENSRYFHAEEIICAIPTKTFH